jgi:hypothetical protein
LQFELTQVLLHDVGHCHAQSSRKVLRRHGLLRLAILEHGDERIRQSLRIPRRIELDCEVLAVRHLAEIDEVCTKNRHAVGARKVRYAAAASRRGIGHDGDAGTLE